MTHEDRYIVAGEEGGKQCAVLCAGGSLSPLDVGKKNKTVPHGVD